MKKTKLTPRRNSSKFTPHQVVTYKGDPVIPILPPTGKRGKKEAKEGLPQVHPESPGQTHLELDEKGGVPPPSPLSSPSPGEETPVKAKEQPRKRSFWEESEEDLDPNPPPPPLSRIILPPRPQPLRALTPVEKVGENGAKILASEDFKTRPIANPETSKDRTGFLFSELKAIQKEHLRQWKKVLTKEAYQELEQFCLRTNKPSDGSIWPGGRHIVPRGHELVDFLLNPKTE